MCIKLKSLNVENGYRLPCERYVIALNNLFYKSVSFSLGRRFKEGNNGFVILSGLAPSSSKTAERNFKILSKTFSQHSIHLFPKVNISFFSDLFLFVMKS